jgi:hypothetical protein
MPAPNIPSQTLPTNVDLVDKWLLGDEEVDWVLKVTPVKLSTSTPETLYFSNAGYRNVTSAASPPRLDLPSFSMSVLNTGFGTKSETNVHRFNTRRGWIVKSSTPRVDYEQFRAGDIEFGELIGKRTDAWASFETFVPFKVRSDPTWNRERITFSIKSGVLNLNKPVQTATFSGTGVGLNGGAELKGKTKPILLGKVDNLVPVLVNTGNLTYMIDPDGVDAIATVYEGGLDVGASMWTADLPNGTFDLEREPDFQITCDATGKERLGTAAPDKYALHNNFRTLLEDFGGLTNTDIPASGLDEEGGLFIGAGETMLYEEALTWCVRPFGFYWPRIDGDRFVLGEWGQPESGTSSRTFTDAHIVSIERIETAPPAFEVRVGYRPLDTMLGSLLGAVTAAEIARLTQPYQYETDTDATIPTDHPNAIPLEALSSLYASADASTLATDILTTLKVKRDIYRVNLARYPLHAWIGNIVTIDHPRYGLSGGKKVMVTGWELDLASRSFSMECWG